MPSAAIRVNLSEVLGQKKDLKRRLDKAGKFDGLREEIGEIIVSSTLDRFETGRGPDDEAWEPSYRALIEGGQTLVNHGHLRSSIHYVIRGRSILVGSNLIYAGVHQGGAEINAKSSRGLVFPLPGRRGANQTEFRRVMSVTIPARPFLGVNSADSRNIQDAVEDHLVESLR